MAKLITRNQHNFDKVKKTAVIFLMLIYGSATMGATVHFHYCMNKLVDSSLWHNEKAECGKCGMNDDKTDCCKDEHKHFKLKADQHKAAAAALINLNFALIIGIPIPYFNFQSSFSYTETYSPCHAPPNVNNTRLHVLHCVFLI